MDRDKEKCRCEEIGTCDQHTCPYREEIDNDSETLCNCCTYCMRRCTEDI